MARPLKTGLRKAMVIGGEKKKQTGKPMLRNETLLLSRFTQTKCFAPDSTQKVLPSEHYAGLGTPRFAVSSLHTVKCHPERSVARSPWIIPHCSGPNGICKSWAPLLGWGGEKKESTSRVWKASITPWTFTSSLLPGSCSDQPLKPQRRKSQKSHVEWGKMFVGNVKHETKEIQCKQECEKHFQTLRG